uniref:Uncharacterized protein n=1 Tax=Oryza glumipatula TaxID=40148 RepID=A0A0D9YI25_9ORYZ
MAIEDKLDLLLRRIEEYELRREEADRRTRADIRSLIDVVEACTLEVGKKAKDLSASIKKEQSKKMQKFWDLTFQGMLLNYYQTRVEKWNMRIICMVISESESCLESNYIGLNAERDLLYVIADEKGCKRVKEMEEDANSIHDEKYTFELVSAEVHIKLLGIIVGKQFITVPLSRITQEDFAWSKKLSRLKLLALFFFNNVLLSNTKYLEQPWDPRGFNSSAWGQAEFKERGLLDTLLGCTTAGPLRKSRPKQTQEEQYITQ